MVSLSIAEFEPAILDRLVNNLDARLAGCLAYRVAPSASLALAPFEVATVSYVVGGGHVRIGEQSRHPIESRSIVVAPAGLSLAWGSGGEESALTPEHLQPIDQSLLSLLRGKPPHDQMVVVTSRVSAAYGSGLGLFDHLSEPIIVRLEEGDPVQSAVELLIVELAQPGIGSRALVEACLQQLLILLFRRYLRLDRNVPLLQRGLHDPKLAGALILVIENPELPHTIKSMARSAGMNRVAFIRQFALAFGQSPLDYVHSLRMRLAARLLSSTDLHVKVIAGKIGLASRSYFSRAFRASYGLDPSAFRLAKGRGAVAGQPTQ